jgi:hypothetical protein
MTMHAAFSLVLVLNPSHTPHTPAHIPNRASTTLFCLSNGDAIMETADQLGALGHSRAFAMAYIVVFIVVFVYVIMNILLVVVQQVSMALNTIGFAA